MQPIPALILYPAAPDACPGRDRVLKYLEEIGLIGDGFEHAGQRCHLPGSRFFQFLTFLGCSPDIVVEPTPGEAVDMTRICHLILGSHARPVARFGAGTVPPRCPVCHQRLEAALAWLSGWREGEERVCPSCAGLCVPERLGWKRTVAFGRFFIEIRNIYPHEAVPVEGLLGGLASLSATDWDYAYVRVEA